MCKKLIFLRDGYPSDLETGVGVINSKFGINAYSIDIDIIENGYNYATKNISNNFKEWYTTTCPSVLSAHDEKYAPMWWNEEEYKWEIYFIEEDKLRHISEYTDKELRAAHNIEKLYLTGGLDE